MRNAVSHLARRPGAMRLAVVRELRNSRWMRVRRALISAGALAVSIAARSAYAQSTSDWTHGARLSWVRTEGTERCPDAVAVEARIRARSAGTDPFVEGPRRMIEAIVRHERGTYLAHITVRDGAGTLLGARDLSSSASDCEALASAAAVAISLSLAAEIDEIPAENNAISTTAASSPRASTTVPGIDPELSVHAERSPAAQRSSSATQWPALRDDAGVIAHVGLLPSPGAGISIGTQLRLTRWVRLGLTFAHLPQQDFAVASGSYAFGLTYGQLDACLEVLGERRATLGFCAGLAAGGLSGLVYELQPVSYGERFWGAATTGVRATVPIYGALEVLLDLEAIVPFTRFQFQLPGGGSFSQAWVAAVARLGLGVRFP